MATLTIRIPDEVKDQLDQLAAAQRITLSDLVRGELEDLILNPRGDGDTRYEEIAPRSISLVDRKVLAMLHRILARVETDEYLTEEGDAANQRAQAQILEHGYIADYARVFSDLHPELPASEVNFLTDVLDMFLWISLSIQQLPSQGDAPVSEELVEALTFSGFDEKIEREQRLLEYTRYLVQEPACRWVDVTAKALGKDGGDSHSPRADMYQRMLDVFNDILEPVHVVDRHRFRLNREQLQRIVDAQRYQPPRVSRTW